MKLSNSYFFTCSCGCGTVSENLKKSIVKLPPNKDWKAEKCMTDQDVKVQNYAGGCIIEKKQF